MYAERLCQGSTEIDHEEREIGSIGDSVFFHIHEIFETPELFGVSEIELDLEAQAVELDDLVISLFQIRGEQNDMRLGGCLEISFDDKHHIQREVELLVDELALIHLCVQVLFRGGFFQVLVRQGVHIDIVSLVRFGAMLLCSPLKGKYRAASERIFEIRCRPVSRTI